ncbi:MAG: hypothetical protein KBA26_07100 [Candidatus Delongbacteria bacterium]|nr:hypothetical protein [Candidatus Delongbacteria bacterium]
MKPMKCFVLILFCWVTLYLEAYPKPRADRDPDLIRCLDILLHERFDQAHLLIDSMIKRYPDDPAPLFVKGMIYWRRSYNMESSKSMDKACQKYWNQTISVSEKLIKTNDRDGYAHFFKGGAYGYLGTLFIRQDSYVKAGLNAIKGINNLESSYRMDSSYWDYYYGNGLYHVAAANSSSIVKFLQKLLPMPSGNENLGVDHLRLAADKGNFTPVLAKAILAFTYTYYRVNYDSAFYYVRPLMVQYPESSDFMVLMLNLYFHQAMTTGQTDWASALKCLDDLAMQMSRREEKLEVWYRDKYAFFKGYCLFKLGRYAESESQLRHYLSQHKKNPYEGAAWLTIGAIEDIRLHRDKAKTAYRKADKCKNIGNLHQLCERFLTSAYQAGHDFYRGLEYKLPEKP